MTLEEIKASTKTYLTAADVEEVVGSNANAIRCMAKQRPELLGFPVTIISNNPDSLYGARVKIPRIPFLRYYGVDV